MDRNSKKFAQKDIMDIVNEATFHSYAISKLSVQNLFQKMTAADYVTLIKLSKNIDSTEDNHKLYLEDIANELKMPMGKISRLVRTLQERGLVTWKHDGSGEEGTYIQITDKGISLVTEQQNTLNSFYVNVIERFGRDKFINLLRELEELEAIMDSEIEEGDI